MLAEELEFHLPAASAASGYSLRSGVPGVCTLRKWERGCRWM